MKHMKYTDIDYSTVDYSDMTDGEFSVEIEGRTYDIDFADWIFDEGDTVITINNKYEVTFTPEDKKNILQDIQENKGPDFADVKFKWEVEHEEPQKR